MWLFTNEIVSVKETLSTNIFFSEILRSGTFIVDSWYKQHGSVIVEITKIKSRPLSKHLTQQHGDCTKRLVMLNLYKT